MATSVISMKELVQDISKEINICIDQIIPQIPPKEVFESVEDEVNQNSLQFQWALEKLEDPSHNIESQTLKFFRLAKILQIELEKIIFAERNKEERALKDEIACLQKEVEHKRKVIAKYTLLIQKWTKEFTNLEEETNTPLGLVP